MGYGDPTYPGRGREGEGRRGRYGAGTEIGSRPGDENMLTGAGGPPSGGSQNFWNMSPDEIERRKREKSRGEGDPERYGERIEGALGRLDDWASGKESVSQEQLRQALGRNVAAEQAMSATGRGSQALRQRQASQNIGSLRSGLAGQQALAGLQERQMASAQYAALLQGLRGQEVSMRGQDMGQPKEPSKWERAAGLGIGLAKLKMMG